MILQQPYWKTKPYFVRLDILNNDSRHKKYVGNNVLIVPLIFFVYPVIFNFVVSKHEKNVYGMMMIIICLLYDNLMFLTNRSTIKLELKGFYL